MEVPRGFTRCDECEGSGSAARWPMKGGDIRYSRTPCPSCFGSGLVPTEKLREEATMELDHFVPDYSESAADAVLRKVAEHLGDRE